jgi:hypothetical protein
MSAQCRLTLPGNCFVREIVREVAGARMRRLCTTRQCRVTAGTPENGDERCGFVRAWRRGTCGVGVCYSTSRLVSIWVASVRK